MLSNLKNYYRPESIKEALTLINDENDKNIIIGGGSFLAFSNDPSIDGLVDIEKLGFDKLKLETNTIKIGSRVSIRVMQKSNLLKKYFSGSINFCASKYFTSLQRNQATIGGILYSSFSNTEIIMMLLGLDTEVIYENLEGEKRIDINKLLKSSPQNTLRYSIIKAIEIKIKNLNVYLQRIAKTETDIPIISTMLIDDYDSGIKKILFSCVNHLPVIYIFKNNESHEQILNRIKNEFKPISDIRASIEYRKEMAIILTKKLLNGESIL